MHEYKLVKEFGEGVDRMFREMESAGNPDPEYKLMLKAKLISTQRDTGGQTGGQMKTKNSATANSILKAMAKDPKVTRKTLSKVLEISPSAVQKHINKLKVTSKNCFGKENLSETERRQE